MDIQQIAPLLKTNKPFEIFKKVVEFNVAASHSGNLAIVRIGLGSGFIIEGTPLKMDTDGNVIFTSLDRSVGYINAKSITGVQIINPEVMMEVLTDGTYFNIPESKVPTSLELKRNFKDFQEKLQQDLKLEVESDVLEKANLTEAEKYQFQQFLKVLKDGLGKVSEDILGQEALKNLKHLKIKSGNGLAIKKESNGALTIEMDFTKKFNAGLGKDLQTALESNL